MAAFYILVLDVNAPSPTSWIFNDSASDENTLLNLSCFSPYVHSLPRALFVAATSTAIQLPSCGDPTATPQGATVYGIDHV